MKNLAVSAFFQGLEGSEVICGVLHAAISDASQQMLGLCTLRFRDVQTITSCIRSREHPYPNHTKVRVPRAYDNHSMKSKPYDNVHVRVRSMTIIYAKT